VILAGLALGVLFVSTASAERLVRGVTDVTQSADERGGSRILFRWDPSVAEGDVAVRKAVLRFDLRGEAREESVTLRVHPVLSAWADGRGTVVFDEARWSHAEIDLRRTGPVVIDVTNLVKEVVEEGLSTHGFLVRTDASHAEGLSASDLARLSGLSSGVIEVVWRKVPPRPRGG
jgi:hypothetical protein